MMRFWRGCTSSPGTRGRGPFSWLPPRSALASACDGGRRAGGTGDWVPAAPVAPADLHRDRRRGIWAGRRSCVADAAPYSALAPVGLALRDHSPSCVGVGACVVVLPDGRRLHFGVVRLADSGRSSGAALGCGRLGSGVGRGSPRRSLLRSAVTASVALDMGGGWRCVGRRTGANWYLIDPLPPSNVRWCRPPSRACPTLNGYV